MSEPIFTVANQLTILRMALVPVLLVFVLSGRHGAALAVFAIAAVTDMLDGLTARLGHQQTHLGAMLDPVADKLFLSSSYVALTWGLNVPCPIPDWLTVTLLSRDGIIVVSVVVVNLTIGRRVFYPSVLGKACTLFQIVTAGVTLIGNARGVCPPFLAALYVSTLAIAVVSAGHYVWRASHPVGTRPAA